MIQITSLHHKNPDSTRIVRSHKLTPHDKVTLFCIIEGEKENTVSVIEDHLLEMISGVEWRVEDIDTDFSYVSENYNHFIQNIDSEDLTGIVVLLGGLVGESLILSTIGHSRAILTEMDGSVNIISTEDLGKYEFHSIVSGEIPKGGTIYLANAPLESILGNEVLIEFSELPESAWIQTSESVLSREYQENLHIIRIANEIEKSTGRLVNQKNSKQNSIIQKMSNTVSSTFDNLSLSEKVHEVINKIPKDSKSWQYGFLVVGIIILFFLIYSIIGAISGVIHPSVTDGKNQLLQAQSLIEQGQKLTNNPVAFSKNIKEAEQILFTLRANKEHIADTQALLDKIEALKKEVNDIQTVDMTKYTSIIPFNPTDISPVGVFKSNNQYTLIGRQGAILGYAGTGPIPKVTAFRPGEEAMSFDVAEDGNFYILTNSNRVMSWRNNDFNYVTVSGQDGWEKAKSIKTFNGNLYLIDSLATQIYRHKPGTNGYSTRSAIFDKTTASPILDIGIDGGIYILTQDGIVQHYVSGKSTTLQNIIMNKIPGEYDIGQSSPTQIFVRSNLSYIYILSGDRIWIFQPDSKRFQDVNSFTYIAQLELQTNEEIRSIYVPRDGTIDVVSNLGVYEVGFEIADNKILLR